MKLNKVERSYLFAKFEKFLENKTESDLEYISWLLSAKILAFPADTYYEELKMMTLQKLIKLTKKVH